MIRPSKKFGSTGGWPSGNSCESLSFGLTLRSARFPFRVDAVPDGPDSRDLGLTKPVPDPMSSGKRKPARASRMRERDLDASQGAGGASSRLKGSFGLGAHEDRDSDRGRSGQGRRRNPPGSAGTRRIGRHPSVPELPAYRPVPGLSPHGVPEHEEVEVDWRDPRVGQRPAHTRRRAVLVERRNVAEIAAVPGLQERPAVLARSRPLHGRPDAAECALIDRALGRSVPVSERAQRAV